MRITKTGFKVTPVRVIDLKENRFIISPDDDEKILYIDSIVTLDDGRFRVWTFDTNDDEFVFTLAADETLEVFK